MDLRQLLWGSSPWGCRRLLSHIRGIPADSAFRRSRLGEGQAEWDTRTELQAATVDLLQVLVRQNMEDPPEFKPVPRPFTAEETRQAAPEKGLDSLQGFLKGI